MRGGRARAADLLVPSLAELPAARPFSAVVLAIKPQVAAEVLPALGRMLPPGPAILSILAGLTVAQLSALLGPHHHVVRAMPNMPAAIGQGMTVAFAGPHTNGTVRALCQRLLAASGEVAWIEEEALIDPITSVSGCGPAYVFLLAELLEAEAVAQGISPLLARQLARRTVSGAGALMAASPDSAAALRQAVTSPNGVTERALAVLMDPAAWPASVKGALQAATRRSRELAALRLPGP